MNEINYVGGGKIINEQYGTIGIYFALEDLPEVKPHKNGKHYIRLAIGDRKAPSQWGDTKRVWIDEQKPKAKEEPEPIAESVDDDIDPEKIPF